MVASIIIATGTLITSSGGSSTPSAPGTKANPFASIINHVMYYSSPIKFEDNYPMFYVHFNNLANYQPVLTEGSTVLEIYNVTKSEPISFYSADDGCYDDPYMPMPSSIDGFPMSLAWVYPSPNGWHTEDGDLLRIRFKVPNDIEYESPVFELYAPFDGVTTDVFCQEFYWN